MRRPTLHLAHAAPPSTFHTNEDTIAKWVLKYSSWSNKQISGRITQLEREYDIEHFEKWSWCPSIAVLRKLGFRARREIDDEQYALRTLRGDFRKLDHMKRAKHALVAAASYA